MNRTNEKQTKNGLFAIGYVENRERYLAALQDLTEQRISYRELNDAAAPERLEYFNGAGYRQYPDGTKVNRDTAKYIRFRTPYTNTRGEELYGWFKRTGPHTKGVFWGCDRDFREQIRTSNSFNIGRMYFDSFEEGLTFLEELATNTIPESWKYRNRSSAINHPILKSYLEHVLERLVREDGEGIAGKIIRSDDGRYVMFNTNLLDKFFHDVIIVGRAETTDGDLRIRNPYRAKSQSELRKIGFGKDLPVPPCFFTDVNEVVFQRHWEIDRDFDSFTHIIEERQSRFPDEYRRLDTDMLARRLDNAIDFAVALCQRNYKFMVPMYRPQTNSIQLLMPIYLSGAYSRHPDFALVLTPDRESELYLPETILPLDAAYQNARLIAKPDEAWLDPDQIE